MHTYDFSDELFNDPDRGESIEQVWLIGGTTIRMTSGLTVYVGGGITTIGRYLKRYDKFEILGSKGKPLLNVEKVRGKVPLLSLFKKSKAINLDFFNPVIHFRSDKSTNNVTEINKI